MALMVGKIKTEGSAGEISEVVRSCNQSWTTPFVEQPAIQLFQLQRHPCTVVILLDVLATAAAYLITKLRVRQQLFKNVRQIILIGIDDWRRTRVLRH